MAELTSALSIGVAGTVKVVPMWLLSVTYGGGGGGSSCARAPTSTLGASGAILCLLSAAAWACHQARVVGGSTAVPITSTSDGYFSRPGYLSPITKMKWIPRPSPAVGLSSFLYALPAIWGAWPMYLLQAPLSFMSDYVMIGKDSWFHPVDRVVALSNAILTIVSAFSAIAWWQVLLFIFVTFTAYGFSVWAITEQNFNLFRVAHTLWHIFSSFSIAYVTTQACGWQTSFSPTCERKWVGLLYCNCLSTRGNVNTSVA